MLARRTPPAPRSRWAHARTAIVVAGLGFVASSLVAACLDHYNEDFGCAPASSSSPTLNGASSEGSDTAPTGADCGTATSTTTTTTTEPGSGSGSAEVP